MLRLVTGSDGVGDEPQDDEIGEQQVFPDATPKAIEISTRSADLANDTGTLQSRRTTIMSGHVYKEIQRVYDEVLSGRLTTFRQVVATLALQRIHFPKEEDTFTDGDIISTYLIQLRDLIKSVESGLPPRLFAINQSLTVIDQAQADNSTLLHLDDLEAECGNEPNFPELQRRIRAIRLIKKAELIVEFRARLHDIMNGEISQETPEEIHQFQYDFFGDGTTPGCGLIINDLRPSPEEKMLLNRLGGNGRGLHPVRDISMPS